MSAGCAAVPVLSARCWPHPSRAWCHRTSHCLTRLIAKNRTEQEDEKEKLAEGLQVVTTSRDKPGWAPRPGSCSCPCRAFWRGRWSEESRRRLALGPSFQCLAQRGTLISFNPIAESGKVWAIGTPKSLGWERVCWSSFPGPAQTSPHPMHAPPCQLPHPTRLSSLQPGVQT